MNNDTHYYDLNVVRKELILKTLKEVYESLRERGYNPTNQIVGYIMSGDPGYISNYKDSRTKLQEFERSELTAVLLEESLNK